MTQSLPLELVQSQLKELVHQLSPGDEIVLVEHDRAVAKLIYQGPEASARPKPGLGRGSILYMSDDFDAPLDEMKDYL